MKKDRHKGQNGNTSLKRVGKVLLFQFLIFCFFVFSFVIGAYLAFLFGCKPEHSFYYACCALMLASVITAAFCAKKEGKKGLLVGLKNTAPAIAVVLAVSLMSAGFRPDMRILISAAILLLGAALGGIIGVNIKSKPKYPQRKRVRK